MAGTGWIGVTIIAFLLGRHSVKMLSEAVVILATVGAFAATAQVPKTWDDTIVATLELPLAAPGHSPGRISADLYYRIPERLIYKSYPVYHPDREPDGYFDWLRAQEPQLAVDFKQLKTRDEWIKAGELVFQAPKSYGPVFFSAADVRDPQFYQQSGMPVGKDGVVPFARWVVRKKGEVELGSMGCNTCHTRVLPDGRIVPGAQGNNPGDRQGARMLSRAAQNGDRDKLLARLRGFAAQFETPWMTNDPNSRARSMPLEDLIAAGEAIPPGVNARSNTSLFLPPQIPDLIGVKDRLYLDHTGMVRHRGVGDLMRYSSLAQDIAGSARPGSRYSDEQLYALSLYLYSLQPPANPNRFGASARLGQKIFKREGCPACHTPPLYTNNKLVAVDGWEPPSDHRKRFDVMERRVGTDARYALESLKGAGYYKVPSLKGLWYRGPLEHNGSVASLEDWFNPARLSDTYVPTGFKGLGVVTRAVKGHEFGLKLPPAEKAALLAFLRTL